jgi:hypothetical protein
MALGIYKRVDHIIKKEGGLPKPPPPVEKKVEKTHMDLL